MIAMIRSIPLIKSLSHLHLWLLFYSLSLPASPVCLTFLPASILHAMCVCVYKSMEWRARVKRWARWMAATSTVEKVQKQHNGISPSPADV